MRISRSYGIFALLCLLSAAVLWRPLTGTILQALHDDEYTYILLILPVSATLIWLDWRARELKPSGSIWTGLSLLLAGAVVAISEAIWAVRLDAGLRLSLGMLALVILWIASFVLCFGASIARSLLFPLCFLFWMVPIPAFAQIRIIHFLQRGSALSASFLFSVAGIPVSQDGILLYVPGLNIEVARECSSIRSSLMLLVTTMVLAYVLLQTPWRRILLIMLAIPLSVAKNGLRIFTIAMLGTRVDRSYLSGHLHHDGGIVFFLIALAMIVIVLVLLRRGEAVVAPVTQPSTARA